MQCHEEGGQEARLREGDESGVAVQSRCHVLARLREAVLSRPRGPLLITGEPGSGKTWISRQLVAALPAGWRASTVTVTASLDALDFLTLAGHSLGLAQSDRPSSARLGIQAVLHDECMEGRKWGLIVDDAHRGAPEVWEEILVLADQACSPGGFAALLVFSDPELIRMAATRRFRSFAATLAEHHHLPPLDLDEARELLGLSAANAEQESLGIEQIHRDAGGNPRRLLRLANSRLANWRRRTPRIDSSSALRSPAAGRTNGNSAGTSWPDRQPANRSNQKPEPFDHFTGPGTRSGAAAEAPVWSETPAVAPSAARPPALIPAKPPIRVEEGLVEVGWAGDLEAECSRQDQPPAASADPSAGAAPAVQETVVEDHYATLQAWAEQATNRLRTRSEGSPAGDQFPSDAVDEAEFGGPSVADGPDNSELRHEPTPAKIRAEGQHDFAPYSQLFTRLRQSS